MEKQYDLEIRTAQFASDCRKFARKLFHDKIFEDDLRQLIRSSGSVAANYIEGNEALGTRDRKMKFKTSRRESKESSLWLNVLQLDHPEINKEIVLERDRLSAEAIELRKILSSIISKF